MALGMWRRLTSSSRENGSGRCCFCSVIELSYISLAQESHLLFIDSFAVFINCSHMNLLNRKLTYVCSGIIFRCIVKLMIAEGCKLKKNLHQTLDC